VVLPPRIVFESRVTSATCVLAAPFIAASLGVTVPPRETFAGLGIIDPAAREAIGDEILVVREVVDMYMGGKIVGAGLALGGSMDDRV